MEKLTVEEWKKEATALFGDDVKKWRFKCIRCGNIQTVQDFLDAGVHPDQAYNMFFFSCLGRVKKGVGCDWSLGGLFTIHTREVINDEGKAVPSFEFDKSAVHGVAGNCSVEDAPPNSGKRAHGMRSRRTPGRAL